MIRITALVDSMLEAATGWRALLPSNTGSEQLLTTDGMSEGALASKVADCLREQLAEAEEIACKSTSAGKGAQT